MRARAVLALVFIGSFAARLCHVKILWIEECYPAAGAVQTLYGMVPYRDFWFDKPPLSIGVYLLWGARTGWVLRLAGALFVTLVCWLLYCFARDRWGEAEGILAATLGAFFLTFGMPSAVMALAPDLLMLAPHVAAVYLAWRRKPFWSGVVAGVAMLIHTKGVYVLAACLIWEFRAIPWVLAGFALPNVLTLGWLAAAGALGDYWQQVWRWGMLYARDTFVTNPLGEALKRTANWAGFHAALVVAATWYWWRERDCDRRRFAAWLLISLTAIVAGWRFFPRYYFHLLPVLVITGARGLTLLGRKRALAVLALLLVPLIRFGPRYGRLALEAARGEAHQWADLAMYQDSVEAAATVERIRKPGDTLLVWGYRPDLFVLTRLRAGAPFLDSQPLTGVIADRHLRQSDVSAPDLAAANRRILTAFAPSILVDGLGLYNPELALSNMPDLAAWMSNYTEAARTGRSVVYRLRPKADPAAP